MFCQKQFIHFMIETFQLNSQTFLIKYPILSKQWNLIKCVSRIVTFNEIWSSLKSFLICFQPIDWMVKAVVDALWGRTISSLSVITVQYGLPKDKGQLLIYLDQRKTSLKTIIDDILHSSRKLSEWLIFFSLLCRFLNANCTFDRMSENSSPFLFGDETCLFWNWNEISILNDLKSSFAIQSQYKQTLFRSI